MRTSPGGKALNQAVALARLGALVDALGVVGGDAVGRDLMAMLSRERVGSSGVECRPGAATTVTVCLVSDVGESSILWHIDEAVAIASGTVTAAQAVIDRADAVLVTFEMPFGPMRELLRAGRKAGAGVGGAARSGVLRSGAGPHIAVAVR